MVDKRKKPIELPVSFPERRTIRYRCMRIRNKNDEAEDDLKERIESQFKRGMSWDNYNIVWDIDKKNPYLVVQIARRNKHESDL
jgi:hypothetical protein